MTREKKLHALLAETYSAHELYRIVHLAYPDLQTRLNSADHSSPEAYAFHVIQLLKGRIDDYFFDEVLGTHPALIKQRLASLRALWTPATQALDRLHASLRAFAGGDVEPEALRVVFAACLSELDSHSRLTLVQDDRLRHEAIRAAAALTETYVWRAADDEADESIKTWIDQVSRAVGPRSTWRHDPVGRPTAPALTEADITSLARLLDEVERTLAGEVLWRLSAEVLAQVRAGVRAGEDWRAATFAACRKSTSLLRVLAAALCEAQASGSAAFDEAVHRLLQLRYSEQALRERATGLRHVRFEVLLEQASAAGCTDVGWLRSLPESADRTLTFVRWLASLPNRGDMLARVLQDVQCSVGEEPATVGLEVAAVGGCSLVVAVQCDSEDGIRAVFWGIPHAMGEQRRLGTWKGKSLNDPELIAAVCAAEADLRENWHVSTDQVIVEFALPLELLAEQVESWQFQRTPRRRERLGVAYPVVLRSSDRLYDRRYQRLWADWEKKWDAFRSKPVLLWLKDPSQAQERAFGKANGVGLEFRHTPDPQDDADPVILCIENMMPVALWRRSTGPGEVNPEPGDLPELPSWVLARRQAEEGADDSIVVMWDDPRRIPSDAREQRMNLARRTVA